MKTNRVLNRILDMNLHHVLYFKMLMEEQELSPDKVVIVVADYDDKYGRRFAKMILPGFNWQAFKDQGGEPLALGLACRKKASKEIKRINPQLLFDLAGVKETPVVVIAEKAADIFSL